MDDAKRAERLVREEAGFARDQLSVDFLERWPPHKLLERWPLRVLR
mgnify:CR=1 FL=1